MANSMALWYERWRTTASDGSAAEVEVHLNLWRHIGKCRLESNFLDVGLLLSNTYEIGRVCLFLPTKVTRNSVKDLSKQLCDDTLLSAVFNDVIKVGSVHECGGYTTTRRAKHYLNFHSATPNRDFVLTDVNGSGDNGGTLLEFSSEFCRKLHQPGLHYVRLRFTLDESGARDFSIKREGWSDLITSSVLSEEFTELRFSEVRNLPFKIAQRMGGEDAYVFNVTSVHCFLIRDTSFELVASHALMHKMRRMEENLWNGYLPPSVPQSDLRKMIVYHWRSISEAGSSGIESFVALARFRRLRDTILWYVAGIILLGALGSGAEGMLANYFADKNQGTSGDAPAFGILVCVLVVLPFILWVSRQCCRLIRVARQSHLRE
ncbi:hypothetical protein V5F32_04750 [Xanthobacter oligotrophicus]|uniref:CorA-like Mg2+ transporter protein n=1 Tax=Xanthobacter oligotrophicus TaxID=2607286 RepID=A0ABW6ZSQ7_9HYPH